jgi:hypothetical protein
VTRADNRLGIDQLHNPASVVFPEADIRTSYRDLYWITTWLWTRLSEMTASGPEAWSHGGRRGMRPRAVVRRPLHALKVLSKPSRAWGVSSADVQDREKAGSVSTGGSIADRRGPTNCGARELFSTLPGGAERRSFGTQARAGRQQYCGVFSAVPAAWPMICSAALRTSRWNARGAVGPAAAPGNAMRTPRP